VYLSCKKASGNICSTYIVLKQFESEVGPDLLLTMSWNICPIGMQTNLSQV
jgi:hypothetical protein